MAKPKLSLNNPPKPKANTPVVADAPKLAAVEAGDQKPVPEPKAGDQKAKAGAKAGDQKSGSEAKKPKKTSDTVIKWRELGKTVYAPTAVITLKVPENPKRNKAKVRFSFYKNGMTVAAYQKAVEACGQTAKGAMSDMRWDVASDFIEIK